MAIHVTIEGYEVLEQIGVGGMAAVYKARQLSIDKIVAIKVLFPYLASDESFIERFQREAKAAARIQHENIVNVIDFGESEGSYFIVMEYYDGQTVEDLLKTRQTLPLDVAVSVILDVCYGLESAHAKDIVHRDIKPGNIIYTSQGGIKIADFGLAKKSDSITMITQQGKVIGTPAYMSPEQAAGRNVGPASDVFSLGVVAYELLSQTKPFDGTSYSEVLEKIQTHEPPALINVNPLVQPDFENVVARMLEKDEGRRYSSIGDVITDLEAAMEKFQISRDRRRLAKYIANPDAYEASFREKMISRCLSQGTYFMQKGQTHLDEAALEFQRILHLDPNNERARRFLEKVLAERGAKQTVAVDAQPVPTPRRRKEDRPGGRTTVMTSASRKRRSWKRPVITLVILAEVIALGWFGYSRGYLSLDWLSNGNKPPRVSMPSNLSVQAGDVLEFQLDVFDPEGDPVRIGGGRLPKGAKVSEDGKFEWHVGTDESGRRDLEFIANDGNNSARAHTSVDVRPARGEIEFARVGDVTVIAGKTLRAPLHASSTSGADIDFEVSGAPSGVRIDHDALVWKTKASDAGTHEFELTAKDGHTSSRQKVTVRVRARQPVAQTGRVEWKLPEDANIYVDGILKKRNASSFAAELGRGRHTLQAELRTGVIGWSQVIDIRGGDDVSLKAADLQYGTLAVYFLGGVGEFQINGKTFSEQPPFSGVKIPVGTHPASCRMNGEGDVHEFSITVKPGMETVVEYELGKDPVVSIEG